MANNNVSSNYVVNTIHTFEVIAFQFGCVEIINKELKAVETNINLMWQPLNCWNQQRGDQYASDGTAIDALRISSRKKCYNMVPSLTTGIA